MLKSLRRLRQVTDLVANDHIIDPSMNQIKLSQRYNQGKEVEHYSRLARRGFYDHEKLFFTQQLHDIARGSDILVVGGGCGREAFAFNNMGYKVDVLDISSSMIQKGRKLAHQWQSDVQFYYANLETYKSDKKYSYIYICTSLINFIQGYEHRLEYLRKAYDLLITPGKIGLEVDVFQYRGLHRFNLASKLLKWKLGQKWEKGDTVRSFYDKHNTTEQTLFYHFYQSSREVNSELKEVGFSKIKHKDDFFFGEKN